MRAFSLRRALRFLLVPACDHGSPENSANPEPVEEADDDFSFDHDEASDADAGTTTTVAPTTSTTTTTIAGTAPTVSNGSFNPAEFDWTPACEVEACSWLEFYVCDPESDLIGAYVKLVDVPFFLFPTTMDWDELIAPGDALTDCEFPFGPVRVPLILEEWMFGVGEDWYDGRVDIIGYDAAGHIGNRLEDVAFSVYYAPTSTSTTSTTTTTTTTTSTTASSTTTSSTTTTTDATSTSNPGTTTTSSTTTTEPSTTTTSVSTTSSPSTSSTSTLTTSSTGSPTTSQTASTTTVPSTATTTTTSDKAIDHIPNGNEENTDENAESFDDSYKEKKYCCG